MNSIRFFQPENPLAKAIAIPGGKFVEAAVADAEEQIHLAKDESLLRIDAILEGVFQFSGDEISTWGKLYGQVREVAGLAGMCGLNELGAAAFSFCTLLDQAQQTGYLNSDHMQVHLGVLRLMRRPSRFSEAERAQILDNLQTMMKKAKPSPTKAVWARGAAAGPA